MTSRQAAAWEDWLSEDMNRPSRDNWYAAQTAAVIAGLFAKDVKVSDFLLEFEAQKAPEAEPELSEEEYMKRARELMRARMLSLGLDPDKTLKAGKAVPLRPPPGQNAGKGNPIPLH
jgi:hypothetical protein